MPSWSSSLIVLLYLNSANDAHFKYESESEVVQLCLTLCDPWTVVGQAPPSMGFSRQEYWSGLPFPSPEDLPDPGIKPRSPALQADSLPSEPPGNSCIFKYAGCETNLQ